MSTNFTVPDITNLPKDDLQAAYWLWKYQDELNAVSHPGGLGTIKVGLTKSEAERDEVLFDYELGLTAEVSELRECFFWKHWSSEAKAGRRFELVSHGYHFDKDKLAKLTEMFPKYEADKFLELLGDSTTVEASEQNAKLEITDMVFFTISILQVLGMTEGDFVDIWADRFRWKYYTEHNLGNRADARLVCSYAQQLVAQVTLARQHEKLIYEFPGVITELLIKIIVFAGISPQQILSLYAQKLVINYKRQMKGRKQIGDPDAEKDNKTVIA